MKKLFLFLVLFLTSVLFVSNVKAVTTEITLDSAIDQEELLNNFFVTKEEINVDETNFQNAIKAFNIDTNEYDYIIAYRENSSKSKILRCWKWEKSSIFQAEPSISFLDYTGNQSYYWFTFVLKISSGKSYTIDYELVNNKLDWSINYVPNENNIIAFNYDSNKKMKYNRSAYRILETSIDLKFGTSASYDFSSNGYNPKRISNFMIDDGELCYSIKKGDILFDKDLTPSWVTPKIPEITFNEIEKKYEDNSNKNMIYHKISINFSIFDIDKYNYLYKTSIDNEWHVITCNDLEYTSYKSQTLYVAVIDRKNYELSGEYDYISTATYTFTNVVGYRPTVDYKIEIDKNEYVNNQKKLYNITLTYTNMTDEYYSTYYNLKDGTTKYIGTGKDLTSYKINYVNDDAIITIYIYTNDNEMIYYTTIDLENIDLDLTKPYIFIMGYNQKNLPNSVAYQYKNTNDTDNKCYYKFGGGELTQESCSSDEIKFRNSSYNTSLSLMIYDNNNKILATKTVNLNFITGYPRLEFETYYSSFVKGQILNVKLLDYQENDTLFYSTDNSNWNQLATQESNSLTFFENTPVYFKIYRNNEVIADSYYYVKIGNYSISISEDNTIDEIKKLTGSSMGTITSFLESIKENTNTISELIKYFYNGLDSNIKAFLIATFTLIIVCSIIILARK